MSDQFSITLNGQPTLCADALTIAQLVALHVPHPDACAIAVNGRVVPRSQYPQMIVQPDDAIEVVRAVGGG